MLKRLGLFAIIATLFSSAASFAQSIPPANSNVNLASSGATSRTQMPSLSVSACTFQAHSTNAGSIYIGGGTVTNASGSNKGIKLDAGDSIGNISLRNLNMVFVAADNAGDDIAYFCN